MKTTNVKIFLDDIKVNQDGTYSIYWGYHNLLDNTIKVDDDDSFLYLQRGEAIILPMYLPKLFYPGKHHRFFCTIINDNTQLIWNFMDHHFKIDDSLLKLQN